MIFSNDGVDSDFVILFSDSMDLDTIDLNNINLDDDSFDENDRTNTALVRLIVRCNRFKQHIACKYHRNEIVFHDTKNCSIFKSLKSCAKLGI